MATKTETIFVIYKYDEYVGEGTKEELEKKTGLRAKYIEELSCKSTNLKKWQVEKVMAQKDMFASYEEVNYSLLLQMVEEYGYKIKELAEILDVHPMTVSYKLNKTGRFKYSELEELEDLFYLDDGELLRGADE